MNEFDEDDLFEQVLNSQSDVSGRFDVDMGGLPDDIVAASADVRPYVEQVRGFMEKQYIGIGGVAGVERGLLDMRMSVKFIKADIQQALKDGRVAAVDGTPIVQPQRYLTGSIYACAVGVLSSMVPLRYQETIVKTFTQRPANATLEDTIDFVENCALNPPAQSWYKAFLEYKEREIAMQCDAPYVIIDGPIVTQNLLTRRLGLKLIDEMYQKPDKQYVGVIKNISASDAEFRFMGRALKPYEMYIWSTLGNYYGRSQFKERYKGFTNRFVSGIGQDILRGVFKVGHKTFGFECHRNHLEAALAIIFFNRNDTPGYEIPFLQAQVDAQLRGKYRPDQASKILEVRLMDLDEVEFYDELGERSLR